MYTTSDMTVPIQLTARKIEISKLILVFYEFTIKQSNTINVAETKVKTSMGCYTCFFLYFDRYKQNENKQKQRYVTSLQNWKTVSQKW